VIELTQATSRPVTYQELLEADEVFLTGTSAEVTPVSCLDGVEKSIGPVTRQVQQLYDRAVRGALPGYGRWLTRVRSCAA
jgi:branched-chain amino acid aminotransferase